MGHLIRPLLGPCSLHQAQQQLIEAHEQLVACGRAAVDELKTVTPVGWGSAAKRVRAVLPNMRSTLLNEANSDQSLTELINQCATVERLLDAINWVLHTAADATLVLCHPTTSSGVTAEQNHDLVIQHQGEHWCFEISDVATSGGDGNQKEMKELLSLGVLSSIRPARLNSEPRTGRSFLVVSTESAQRLLRPTRHFLKTGELRYQAFSAGPATTVLEVLRCQASVNEQLDLLQPGLMP